MKAIKRYEKYLEKVKNANTDEFAEIPDILMRYRTLIKENESLNAIYEQENQRLDIKR